MCASALCKMAPASSCAAGRARTKRGWSLRTHGHESLIIVVLPLPEPRSPRAGINPQALRDERVRPGRATATPAEHGANPGDHLADDERLHHVIVGPELEADHAISHGPARRTMMIGTSESRRSRRQTSRPSPSGNARSSKTTSGCRAASSSIASAPVRATVVGKPPRIRAFANGSAIDCSSSTSRTERAGRHAATSGRLNCQEASRSTPTQMD